MSTYRKAPTRLEELYALRAKVNHQIAAELRRTDPGPYRRRAGKSQAVKTSDLSTREVLVALGVTPRQVKAWAVSTGLLPAVCRGRLARWVLDAYAEAHD